jgi:protein phosphatase
MAVQLKIGKCSVIGNYRENNEDAVSVTLVPEVEKLRFNCCIVADGMGGQQAGEKASQMASEVIPRELHDKIGSVKSAEDLRRLMRKVVVQANEEIINMGKFDRDYKNMGTTVVLALWAPEFRDDCIFVAGVGDSRAYLAREGRIEQLTTDHSLAQALVEAKTITPEEAREHRFKNVLWKFLGSTEVGEGPEVKTIFIRPGDILLLCTDGLTGAVDDDGLLDALQQNPEPQDCAEKLCQLALDCGSKDNVSTLVIQVTDEG